MTEIQSEIGAIASRAERQGGCIIAVQSTIQCLSQIALLHHILQYNDYSTTHHGVYVVGWNTWECGHIRAEMQTKVVSTVPPQSGVTILLCCICNTLLLKRIYTPGRPQAPLDELVSLLHALLPLQPLL